MSEKKWPISFGRLIIAVVYILLFAGLIHGLKHGKPSEHNGRKVLHIFGWPEEFLPSTIEKFTEQTGIEIRTHLYLSNEELLTKVRRMKHAEYDILIPSDYAVKTLIKEDMLQPIDHSRLNFYDNLIPELLNLEYDPGNTYSLPYQWEVLGFGVDKDYYGQNLPKLTWKDLMNPDDCDARISMVDDPIEAIQMAAFYLFGAKEITTLSKEEKAQVLKALKAQKKSVEAYTSMKPDYLLATKNCHMAASSSAWILRSVESHPHMDFVIPEDWSFISIENMCIHKNSDKHDEIYAFLNFIYQDAIMAEDSGTFLNFPALSKALSLMENPSPSYVRCYQKALKNFSHFHFIAPLLSEEETRRLWVDLKS